MRIRKIINLLILLFSAFSLSSCDFFEDDYNYYNLPNNFPVVEDANSNDIYKNWTQLELINLVNDISIYAIQANVEINVTVESGFFSNDLSVSQGSGVIFHEEDNYYFVLTNEHVVNPDESGKIKYYVYDYLGYEYTAYLLDGSVAEEYDLAILVFEKTYELVVLSMTKHNPSINELVFSLGQPHGQPNTITAGKVLKYEQATLDDKFFYDFQAVKHSGPIDNGSSGGALINSSMQIVGINFAGADDQSYSLAVPVFAIFEYLDKYVYHIDS